VEAKEKGIGKGARLKTKETQGLATSGRWTELVEKMRQSLGLSGNNELTSPTEESSRK
jgi:hypothetical protein